jgi:hypothetical protein
MSLSFKGSIITASLDAQVLATVQNSTYPKGGMVVLQTGWHAAYFDDFELAPAAVLD